MGVQSCNRKGCNEIMCETHIPNIGYICEGCQAEFKYFFERGGRRFSTEYDIQSHLRMFMVMTKIQGNTETKIDVASYFKKFTD